MKQPHRVGRYYPTGRGPRRVTSVTIERSFRSLLATLQGHRGGVRGAALSADGELLASGGFLTARCGCGRRGSGRAHWRPCRATPRPGCRCVALSADEQAASQRLWGRDGAAVGGGQRGTCLRTMQAERRYERMDITGLTGVTSAQRAALLALGAVEKSR